MIDRRRRSFAGGAGGQLRSLPGLQTLLTSERAWLPHDPGGRVGAERVPVPGRHGLCGSLGRDVNPNHEVIALGPAIGATGLFQGFPISSSASRTPVADRPAVRSPEFWLSIACFLGVAILGVIPGIFLSIGLAAGAAGADQMLTDKGPTRRGTFALS